MNESSCDVNVTKLSKEKHMAIRYIKSKTFLVINELCFEAAIGKIIMVGGRCNSKRLKRRLIERHYIPNEAT